MATTEVPHRVAALVVPPQSPFELGCICEVFGIERPGLPLRYELAICAEQPGAVATRTGFDIDVRQGLSAFDSADTIVVTGWPARADRPPKDLLHHLTRAHARGARVVGICSGTFVLAAAGLLDGRTATTHWRMADELSSSYPSVRVDRDVLYRDHGDVATSAGTSAAIDLCLHLVRTDFGAAYAAEIARHMVMPPQREGGQLQYSRGPVLPMPTSLAAVMAWAEQRLGDRLTLADFADRAGASSRTVARRFEQQLGVSPGSWLLRQRITAACTLLEDTDLTIEVIASRVGLSSATNLRRRFLNELNTTPGAYRRTFRGR